MSKEQITDKIEMLIDLGRFKEAISLIGENLNDYEDKYYMHHQLVYCYLELDDVENAQKALDIVLEDYPNYAVLHYFSSVINTRNDNLNEAIKSIQTAIELDPNNVAYLAKAAILNTSLNKTKQASNFIRLAEQEDPNHIMVLKAKTINFMHTAKMQEAFDTVNTALEIEPNDADLLSLRSQISTTKSFSIEEAEENAYQALAMDPNNEIAKESLLNILKNKKFLFRFFAGNAFNQYVVEFTPIRVIVMILFWKGVLIWGGFGILYLLLTWYGGVLFNTVLRLHKRYKILLDKVKIKQSNLFLGLNVALFFVPTLLGFIGVEPQYVVAVFINLLAILLISISYFEISTKKGKTQFFVFCGIAGTLALTFAVSSPLILIVLPILLLLIYAFLFTLRIAFY